MSDSAHQYARRAYNHIHELSVGIGARPSTGDGERVAAGYMADVMRAAGMANVRLEPFRSPSSTYAPYQRIFATALAGSLLANVAGPWGKLAGALLSALAARGFYDEADLAPGWVRRLVPFGTSQNVVAVIPARQQARQRVVLYGHLDTHRTPIFYSSPTWLAWFSRLIGAGFVSLGLNAAIYAGQALAEIAGLRGARGLPKLALRLAQAAATGLQLFGLSVTVQGDLTPYTPGANDNASGAATALALGERLAATPLDHTEVWIVGTGCEELGSHGIAALLHRHGAALRDAFLIGFDMVGIGDPAVVSEQGLLRRRPADATLLAHTRTIAAELPHLRLWEHPISAFDDSYMVARMGFRGITIDAEGRPGSDATPDQKHWHRMSDTIDKVRMVSLAGVHEAAWELLQRIDQS